MSTLNVSMPESMRTYVENMAEQGRYSSSEYIRYLIREDQKRHEQTERNLLWDYLALSAKQLDDDDLAHVTIEKILTDGRQQRNQKNVD